MAVSGKRAGPPSGLELRAYHEAGHAVTALLKGFSLTRVTISRHGRVAGTCEYRFRIPRSGSRSGALRLARAGAAVALAGSAAQDAVAAERGWVAVDARTGAPVRPFAPGAGDDARVAKRFARLVHRSPGAQRAFLARMRASTDALLRRPLAWAAVRSLARTLLRGRTLCGEHAVESILRATASAGARLAPRGPRSRGGAARRRGRLASSVALPKARWTRRRLRVDGDGGARLPGPRESESPGHSVRGGSGPERRRRAGITRAPGPRARRGGKAMTFRDRTHAGWQLGGRLDAYRAERPIVLGLTRGGVPVALEVARLLDAELDVIVVRKIGAPGSPEYAVGAVAEGGAAFVSREALRDVGASEEWLAEAAAREGAEVVRRAEAYRGGRPMRDLAGRIVIVVDDGVATGATARAAGRAARQRGAARVVLAVPVIAAASEQELRSEFDAVVAVERPEAFFAVSQWYDRFEQVSDEDVVACLRRASGPEATRSLERMGAWPSDLEEETLAIPFDDSLGPGELDADLVLPEGAKGLVMFVHGSGSTRRSPRNRFVARTMQDAGLGTLLFDLLTPDEAAEDAITARLRFDIRLLTGRVLAATRWIAELPRTGALPLCYFGASTGAAAALAAAAAMPERIAAVVSRGGRPDLVEPQTLRKVRAPVLLVVGGRDETVLRLNRSVLPLLPSAELTVIPGATHLFEEPGALGGVARLAAQWLERHLPEGATLGEPRAS